MRAYFVHINDTLVMGEWVNMQMNMTTDYAIRAVLYLAKKNEIVTTREISENMDIPHSVTLKILNRLKQAGIAANHLGTNGGFTLNLDPADISILDIIKIVEPTVKINRCLECDAYCSLMVSQRCPVKKSYCIIQKHIETEFAKRTVASMVSVDV